MEICLQHYIEESIMTEQRTRSQKRILQILKKLDGEVSAQELHLELRNRGQTMGLATVYRSLEALKREGEVQVRVLANGESVYTTMQKDQHHLTCVNCGIVITLDQCPVSHIEEELEETRNFKVFYHTLEFFGLCRHCQLASSK